MGVEKSNLEAYEKCQNFSQQLECAFTDEKCLNNLKDSLLSDMNPIHL